MEVFSKHVIKKQPKNQKFKLASLGPQAYSFTKKTWEENNKNPKFQIDLILPWLLVLKIDPLFIAAFAAILLRKQMSKGSGR